MGTRTRAIAALAAAGLLLSFAAFGHAEVPLLREIASTTITPGEPVALSLARDGSVHVLVEDSAARDSRTSHDPKLWAAKPYVIKLNRTGAVTTKVDIGRPSDRGQEYPYSEMPFIWTLRGKSPVAMLAGGDMMSFGSDQVMRFDATGKKLFTKTLRWGKPARYRGDILVVDLTADGGVILQGGMIANTSEQWIVKVSGDGTVAWSKGLAYDSLLHSYRTQANGTALALWNWKARPYLARLDAKGVELTRVGISCNVDGAALSEASVIAACRDRVGVNFTVFDLAGRKLKAMPGKAVEGRLLSDRDGILRVTEPPDDRGAYRDKVLESYDTNATLRWRSPVMRIEDVVRTPDGDVVILTADTDGKVWRAVRFVAP